MQPSGIIRYDPKLTFTSDPQPQAIRLKRRAEKNKKKLVGLLGGLLKRSNRSVSISDFEPPAAVPSSIPWDYDGQVHCNVNIKPTQSSSAPVDKWKKRRVPATTRTERSNSIDYIPPPEWDESVKPSSPSSYITMEKKRDKWAAKASGHYTSKSKSKAQMSTLDLVESNARSGLRPRSAGVTGSPTASLHKDPNGFTSSHESSHVSPFFSIPCQKINSYDARGMAKFMVKLGYRDYATLMIQHNVTGPVFLEVSDAVDLYHMGIRYQPHRVKLLNLLARLKKKEKEEMLESQRLQYRGNNVSFLLGEQDGLDDADLWNSYRIASLEVIPSPPILPVAAPDSYIDDWVEASQEKGASTDTGSPVDANIYSDQRDSAALEVQTLEDLKIPKEAMATTIPTYNSAYSDTFEGTESSKVDTAASSYYSDQFEGGSHQNPVVTSTALSPILTSNTATPTTSPTRIPLSSPTLVSSPKLFNYNSPTESQLRSPMSPSSSHYLRRKEFNYMMRINRHARKLQRCWMNYRHRTCFVVVMNHSHNICITRAASRIQIGYRYYVWHVAYIKRVRMLAEDRLIAKVMHEKEMYENACKVVQKHYRNRLAMLKMKIQHAAILHINRRIRGFLVRRANAARKRVRAMHKRRQALIDIEEANRAAEQAESLRRRCTIAQALGDLNKRLSMSACSSDSDDSLSLESEDQTKEVFPAIEECSRSTYSTDVDVADRELASIRSSRLASPALPPVQCPNPNKPSVVTSPISYFHTSLVSMILKIAVQRVSDQRKKRDSPVSAALTITPLITVDIPAPNPQHTHDAAMSSFTMAEETSNLECYISTAKSHDTVQSLQIHGPEGIDYKDDFEEDVTDAMHEQSHTTSDPVQAVEEFEENEREAPTDDISVPVMTLLEEKGVITVKPVDDVVQRHSESTVESSMLTAPLLHENVKEAASAEDTTALVTPVTYVADAAAFMVKKTVAVVVCSAEDENDMDKESIPNRSRSFDTTTVTAAPVVNTDMCAMEMIFEGDSTAKAKGTVSNIGNGVDSEMIEKNLPHTSSLKMLKDPSLDDDAYSKKDEKADEPLIALSLPAVTSGPLFRKGMPSKFQRRAPASSRKGGSNPSTPSTIDRKQLSASPSTMERKQVSTTSTTPLSARQLDLSTSTGSELTTAVPTADTSSVAVTETPVIETFVTPAKATRTEAPVTTTPAATPTTTAKQPQIQDSESVRITNDLGDWLQIVEGKSKFYFHKVTKECSFEIPDLTPSGSKTAATPRTSGKSGKFKINYNNPFPYKAFSSPTSPDGSPTKYGSVDLLCSPTASEKSLNPVAQWSIYMDEESHQPFYYNTVTEVSSWIRPDDYDGVEYAENEPGDAVEDLQMEVIQEEQESDSLLSPSNKYYSRKLPSNSNKSMSMADWQLMRQRSFQSSVESPMSPLYNMRCAKTSPSKGKESSKSSVDTDPEVVEENPHNWIVYWDPQNGCHFYYNKLTEESSWEMPSEWLTAKHKAEESEGMCGDVDASTIGSKPKLRRLTSLLSTRCDRRWEAYLSEDTNQPYYYNKETKETSWEPPEEVEGREESEQLFNAAFGSVEEVEDVTEM